MCRIRSAFVRVDLAAVVLVDMRLFDTTEVVDFLPLALTHLSLNLGRREKSLDYYSWLNLFLLHLPTILVVVSKITLGKQLLEILLLLLFFRTIAERASTGKPFLLGRTVPLQWTAGALLIRIVLHLKFTALELWFPVLAELTFA